ncbi:MAG: hypothetical protein HY291_06760 [Planctomycetes bacterium]|nr:hypothetical protein [Planctomycetota bacterium]
MRFRFQAAAALLILAAGACAAEKTADPADDTKKWESSIRAFEKQDKERPPPKDPILLVGSSSFTKWKTAAEDLKPLPILNRGFGGSDMHAVLAYYKRLVLPYHPRTILLYEGGNDIVRGDAPEKVVEGIKVFVENVNRDLPETKVLILSIHLCPSRTKYEAKNREANRLVEEYCKTAKNAIHLDATTALLQNDKLRPEIYGDDKTHLNAEGYKLWAAAIKPVLEKVHAVNEPAAAK